jgi:carbonic anhydrase/acetyltransferase-like protein (isoleucine patch superfamily)
MEYDDARDEKFQTVYNMVHMEPPKNLPRGASINRYSYFCGDSRVEENVLVSQRAYVDSSFLGKGANAQENTQIINSTLSGMDVTAHGAAIINSHLETNVFVGFNSFLMGTPENKITLKRGVIVLPHTIIDPKEPIVVPEDTLVWGLIRTQKDLEEKSIAAADLEKVTDTVTAGAMTFSGSGQALVEAFRHRIEHILEVNGAFYDGKEGKGHAQTEEHISFSIIQPYPEGPKEGLFPSMTIDP